MKRESLITYPEGLIDKHATAEWLGVSVSWVEKKAAAREIPFTKIGNENRWSADDLAEIVAEGKQEVWRYEAPARTRLRAVS